MEPAPKVTPQPSPDVPHEEDVKHGDGDFDNDSLSDGDGDFYTNGRLDFTNCSPTLTTILLNLSTNMTRLVFVIQFIPARRRISLQNLLLLMMKERHAFDPYLPTTNLHMSPIMLSPTTMSIANFANNP